MALLDETELGQLLRGFSRSAFRFELRERYDSTVGREPFRRYLAGEPDDHAWHRGWMEMIRRDRTQGKVWQRVRIVSVPLSDYNRYAMAVARLSIEAGEDIRYLEREAAARLGIAPYDAWLLDDDTLVRLRFHDDDTFAGGELLDDPAIVESHREWRRRAWQHAETLDLFATTHR